MRTHNRCTFFDRDIHKCARILQSVSCTVYRLLLHACVRIPSLCNYKLRKGIHMYIYMYANIHVCLLERARWTNANKRLRIITQPEPKPLLFLSLLYSTSGFSIKYSIIFISKLFLNVANIM